MRYIILSILAVVLVSCNPASNYQTNDPICGLASPVVFTGDTAKFYLSDYMVTIPAELSIQFPGEVEVIRTADINRYILIRRPELPLLSAISIHYPEGDTTVILVKNFKREKIHIRFNPGERDIKDVKVRGSLNFWNARLSEMKQDSNGLWIEEFQLSPGEYQYLLVCDGKEICDPGNPDSVDNNMGGFNSLLIVGQYKQEELPFIHTESYKRKRIKLVCNFDVTQVIALWQNQKTLCSLNGKSISVEIPRAARTLERSFVRVIGYNESGMSNDILIPLEKGRVVTDPIKLTRYDRQTMILYFMMIDRFYDGNPDNNQPVDDPEILPKANYFGGDIAGIDKKILDGYFNTLGINTLWLSPITQNPLTAYGLYPNPRTRFSGYHGYWPVSSTKIDFRYGTSDELRKFIADAHSRNMNVLLDYVAHHVHELHPVYQQHPEWTTSLYLPDGTLNTEKWDEYRLTTWFDTFLPTLDLRRPEVVDPMTDSALIWIEKSGFDGFRHDATKHIDELFWRTLTRKLKTVSHCNPMVFQIGETYGSPELIGSYIGSGMLDAQFDFNVYDDAVAVFARPTESFQRLKNSLNQSLRYYGYHNLMGYITGNQDRPRFISLAGGDLKFSENAKYAGWTRDIGVGDSSAYKKLMMLHAFNMTIPGIPTIYYGDEIGLPGANDPDNRRWMKFNGFSDSEKKVKQVLSTLTHLRSNSMSLLYGDIQFLTVSNKELIYIRRYFDDFTIVIFNKANQPKKIEISDPLFIDKELTTVFGSVIVQNNDKLSLEITPMNFEVVIPK